MSTATAVPPEPIQAQDSAIPLRQKRTNRQALVDELIDGGEFTQLTGLEADAPQGRLLTADKDLWSHNAWDKVEWGDEQQQMAQAAVERQMAQAVPPELQEQYNADPASYWDTFYANMKDSFFNDRAWLRTEFPELADALKAESGPKRIVEIGCGPGNTLYPLLDANENPQLELHGYDFSREAVELVKSNVKYDPKFVTSAVWDLSSTSGLPPTLPAGTVDVAIMIFVLSALHPNEWAQAVRNAWDMLKPGGLLLLRDYGRNDMAQLRFKANRYMQPGLYVRGDHTRVYFFERDELVEMFGAPRNPPPPSSDNKPPSVRVPEDAPSTPTALPAAVDKLSLDDDDETRSTPRPAEETVAATARRFELISLGIDRRLLLNRKKLIKMYRIWLQGRWRKPLSAQGAATASSPTTTV